MADKRYLFVIDDEPIQNEMLKDYIDERFIYDVKTYENGEQALKDIELNPEIVVLDYHLNAKTPDAKNGVEILKEIKTKLPDAQVVMISGQDKIEVAVDSMRYGAYDYVVKGETSFNRIENSLKRISELNKAYSLNAAQKKTITFLTIGIIAIVILALALLYTTAYSH